MVSKKQIATAAVAVPALLFVGYESIKSNLESNIRSYHLTTSDIIENYNIMKVSYSPCNDAKDKKEVYVLMSKELCNNKECALELSKSLYAVLLHVASKGRLGNLLDLEVYNVKTNFSSEGSFIRWVGYSDDTPICMDVKITPTSINPKDEIYCELSPKPPHIGMCQDMSKVKELEDYYNYVKEVYLVNKPKDIILTSIGLTTDQILDSKTSWNYVTNPNSSNNFKY